MSTEQAVTLNTIRKAYAKMSGVLHRTPLDHSRTLAAILQGKIPVTGKTVSIISGGNIDVNTISRIFERGLIKAGRRIRLSTVMDDRPGMLIELLFRINMFRANVLNVQHSRIKRNVPLNKAFIEISLETRDAMHSEEIVAKLREDGYEIAVS